MWLQPLNVGVDLAYIIDFRLYA